MLIMHDQTFVGGRLVSGRAKIKVSFRYTLALSSVKKTKPFRPGVLTADLLLLKRVVL